MASRRLIRLAQTTAMALLLATAACGGGGGDSSGSSPTLPSGTSPPPPPPPPPTMVDPDSSQDPERTAPILFATIGTATANPDAVLALSPSQTRIELFLETGLSQSAAGETLCHTAGGHEICGYLLAIEATGAVRVSGFEPAEGIDLVWTQNGERDLSLAWVSPDDGVFGIQSLGALNLSFDSGAGGLVLQPVSQSVGAAVQVLPVLTNDRPGFTLIAELPA